VAIDPNNPQVVYASRRLTRMLKSTNGGNSFTALTSSPNGVTAVGVSPHDSNVLYAVVNTAGISKSIDGGLTWVEQLSPTPSLSRYIERFTFHPTDPNIVYAPASSGGLWKTTNGGTTWNRVSLPQDPGLLLWAQSALIDPVVPTTIIVGSGNGNGFLRSVDDGLTWETTPAPVIPGSSTGLGAAVLDPADPAVVIASIYSAGVGEYRVAPDLASPCRTFPGHCPAAPR
jgi:hypothetical protein